MVSSLVLEYFIIYVNVVQHLSLWKFVHIFRPRIRAIHSDPTPKINTKQVVIIHNYDNHQNSIIHSFPNFESTSIYSINK